MKNLLYLVTATLIIVTSIVPVVAAPEFSCADVTDIPAIECEALVALYNSTNGPGWTDSTNWLSSTTADEWSGVMVDLGHVVAIGLGYNNMIGSIPPELGNLTLLNKLDLSTNQLSDSIPPELGNLSNLTYLYMKDNHLSGRIPPELGNLTNLMFWTLYFNQLSGRIPPELGNLTNLRFLDLGYNHLSGSIPSELGNLSNLIALSLPFNQLSGNIPLELGHLTRLNFLDIRSNLLSGTIPPELGNLTSLKELNLIHNQLSGNIPPELSNLSNLELLGLNINQLSGNIPTGLGNLTNLKQLLLRGNQLSGDIPSSLQYLTNLWSDSDGNSAGLDLDYNSLNIPPGYPDPNDPLQVFLSQYDNNWQLYQGFEKMIGAGGGEIISLDGRTDILIPPDALNGDTTFTFKPNPFPYHDFNYQLIYANNSFELTAEDAVGNPVITFNLPLTVTLTYTDNDIFNFPEDSLGLWYWNAASNTWMDADLTCPGEYTRDPTGNLLSLQLCHLTEFGLFGTPLRVFLPVISH